MAANQVMADIKPMQADVSEIGGDGLHLHEEITLLALRDKEGTMQASSGYGYAAGGAMLAELLLTGRLGVDADSKRQWAKVLSSEATGDPILDECMDKVVTAKRRAVLQTWVSRFAGIRQLKVRIAERLCRKGILKADEDKVLWFFRRRIYPEVNPAPEKRLIERMRKAVTSGDRELDPRTVAIISLAKSTGLLKPALGKQLVQRRKARIEKIVKGDIAGKATQEAIAAMQAAIMAATVIPTVIATTGS